VHRASAFVNRDGWRTEHTLNQSLPAHDVTVLVVEDTDSKQTITTCTTRLLIISFNRLGQRVVYYKAHVWLVNPHTKRYCCTDHLHHTHCYTHWQTFLSNYSQQCYWLPRWTTNITIVCNTILSSTQMAARTDNSGECWPYSHLLWSIAAECCYVVSLTDLRDKLQPWCQHHAGAALLYHTPPCHSNT